MSETLKSIIASYRFVLLSTPNIQVLEKKLSDEIIKFPSKPMADLTFDSSTFKNSDLINMEFINVNFESSYFKKCLVENCIFENTIFRAVEFDDCMFKNCRFIKCNLGEINVTETIFNECTFLKNSVSNAIFESCHFLNSIFEGMQVGPIGSAVLIDSKFSNSKKSIKFEGEVYFNAIFDQIDKLYID
uniref:Pentapeptide repeat-containing protein n=1 Tax=Climaconeis cf. scalaris TaxID=2846828 RepID=A0A8F8X8G8_9STRA|nr:hypothetical protein [Climaconeis cf. scalaris]QYB19344.1 hypothetical protein [Climaconeis cf. scalaris]